MLGQRVLGFWCIDSYIWWLDLICVDQQLVVFLIYCIVIREGHLRVLQLVIRGNVCHKRVQKWGLGLSFSILLNNNVGCFPRNKLNESKVI